MKILTVVCKDSKGDEYKIGLPSNFLSNVDLDFMKGLIIDQVIKREKAKGNNIHISYDNVYVLVDNPYFDPELKDMSMRCFFCRGNKQLCNCNKHAT